MKYIINNKGSMLLEALISITILMIIVSSSLYSYIFVQARFQDQLNQRKILSLAQGFMENILYETDKLFLKTNRNIDLETAKIVLEQYFNTNIKTKHPYSFVNNDQIYFDINFLTYPNNPRGVMAELNLDMNQFALSLYTKKYLTVSR